MQNHMQYCFQQKNKGIAMLRRAELMADSKSDLDTGLSTVMRKRVLLNSQNTGVVSVDVNANCRQREAGGNLVLIRLFITKD